MPVEGAIPQLSGIEMSGNSIPAETVGGHLFEYINLQQRQDVDARVERAQRLSKEFLTRLPEGAPLRNLLDDQVQRLPTDHGNLIRAFSPRSPTRLGCVDAREPV